MWRHGGGRPRARCGIGCEHGSARRPASSFRLRRRSVRRCSTIRRSRRIHGEAPHSRAIARDADDRGLGRVRRLGGEAPGRGRAARRRCSRPGAPAPTTTTASTCLLTLKYRGRTKAPLAKDASPAGGVVRVRRVERRLVRRRSDEPYTTPTPFPWLGRMRLVGGRTNVWGRQSYRLSDADFKAASLDGSGDDWPLGYADLAPYYDIVEGYVGISGRPKAHPSCPTARSSRRCR